VVDGLWGGIEATDMPVKWKSAPFNNDFPSSLFISQDEVALESVCIDFLRAEADINTAFKDRPFFPAVDDYLHQAADPANWPTGISYDPEGDGSTISSLGVHEHWDNSADKKYTRNLGTGNGIELIFNPNESGPNGISEKTTGLTKINIFPNPCTAETNLSYNLETNAYVSIYLLSTDGKMVQNIKEQQMDAGYYNENINTTGLKSGNYICVIKSSTLKGSDLQTIKLQVK
jgi:hypothetical protein